MHELIVIVDVLWKYLPTCSHEHVLENLWIRKIGRKGLLQRRLFFRIEYKTFERSTKEPQIFGPRGTICIIYSSLESSWHFTPSVLQIEAISVKSTKTIWEYTNKNRKFLGIFATAEQRTHRNFVQCDAILILESSLESPYNFTLNIL